MELFRCETESIILPNHSLTIEDLIATSPLLKSTLGLKTVDDLKNLTQDQTAELERVITAAYESTAPYSNARYVDTFKDAFNYINKQIEPLMKISFEPLDFPLWHEIEEGQAFLEKFDHKWVEHLLEHAKTFNYPRFNNGFKTANPEDYSCSNYHDYTACKAYFYTPEEVLGWWLMLEKAKDKIHDLADQLWLEKLKSIEKFIAEKVNACWNETIVLENVLDLCYQVSALFELSRYYDDIITEVFDMGLNFRRANPPSRPLPHGFCKDQLLSKFEFLKKEALKPENRSSLLEKLSFRFGRKDSSFTNDQREVLLTLSWSGNKKFSPYQNLFQFENCLLANRRPVYRMPYWVVEGTDLEVDEMIISPDLTVHEEEVFEGLLPSYVSLEELYQASKALS